MNLHLFTIEYQCKTCGNKSYFQARTAARSLEAACQELNVSPYLHDEERFCSQCRVVSPHRALSKGVTLQWEP